MRKGVVNKVEPWMDRQQLYATTHQMRNFYAQLRDGLPRTLEVMNYIQHHQVVRMMGTGDHVLDICCGRGLLLPMMRYQKKTIGSYTGIDIQASNARFLERRVTDGKPINAEEYYPWPVYFVEGDVAQMSDYLPENHYDLLVYTSSIEHMHKVAGQSSLIEARKVAVPNATLFLTCPNTPEDQDGYDTQYKAHIYEWKRSELEEGLPQAGWKIEAVFGLLHTKTDLQQEMEHYGMGQVFELLTRHVPNEWLIPVLSPLFPGSAKEIGFICTAV